VFPNMPWRKINPLRPRAIPRRWRKISLICVCLGGLLPPQMRAQLTAPLRELGYEVVALQRTQANHWYVVGRAEGRRRSCLVDTGWSYTTVTTNTAARLDQTNLISALRLNRVTLGKVPVQVADLRVNGQPVSYDVVLGADFLVRHQALLDCGNARLYLRTTPPTAGERGQLETTLKELGWITIPLTRLDPPAWSIATQVNQHPLALLVDSGATWSCVDPHFAALLGLRVTPSLHQISGPAAAGRRNFSVAALREWRWGEQAVAPRNVAVFPLREWGLGPEGKLFPQLGGILGGAELLDARAVLDASGDQLWLRRLRR
jgi:predicted aspartyl protease